MRIRPLSTVHVSYMFILALMLTGAPADAQKRAASAADLQQMIGVQVALDRAGFSPGEIDGRGGPKTRQAISEFQKSSGLPSNGMPNEETIAALQIAPDSLVSYTITPQDVAGPFLDKMPQDMMESAKLEALSYTSPLELLGEKFHSSPALLKTLNPAAKWTAGEEIKVPNVEPFEVPTKPVATQAAKSTAGAKPAPGAKPAAGAKPVAAAAVEVVLVGATKSLMVRDSGGKILMYAPITTGSEHDPLPVGEWKVVGVSWNPTFNYNPDLFWDADPTHAKAKIPAGPNNPVGVVWVDINKAHFGLHGTPEPSAIGRTESHGCVRLTNWDAVKLARLVSAGTKVSIQ
jgi:lipoprotein-anchoring transpeptidase ErfK/SrfK